MTTETKRDVFDALMADMSHGSEQWRARYDAALPDYLPVIPEAVGDAIKIHKDYAHSLLDIFGALSIYDVSRTELSVDYNVWIVHHPEAFACAWVLGVWKVAETGEVVKL